MWAKDRTLSVVDPEMRVGHKSQRQAWAGYKVHIAEEPESELITEVGVRRANEYDADAAFPMDGAPERVHGTQAEGAFVRRGLRFGRRARQAGGVRS